MLALACNEPAVTPVQDMPAEVDIEQPPEESETEEPIPALQPISDFRRVSRNRRAVNTWDDRSF